MSGLLFVPIGTSPEKPIPGIVVSHGMFNNREMQDLNYVELSRRGFVVLSMDMFNHGHSENSTSQIGGILLGMYEAVKMLDSLPYVDSSRIGITGHSLGGMSSNVAVNIDNAAPHRLVAAVLLNCADATYVNDTGEFVDIYGGRDVGIIAAKYDEFFMRQDDEKGNTTIPREYINYSNAQSFLHFGTNPASLEKRSAETLYHKTIDGQDAMRVIYNPAIIHPWSHFSRQSTIATINFFTESLGAPNPIAAENQIWQLKVIFNLLGLVGFGIFVVCFTILMTFTPFFSSLRVKEPPTAVAGDRTAMLWFWIGLGAACLFGTLLYIPILNGFPSFTTVKTWGIAQSSPFGVSMWAAFCGVFSIVFMIISYRIYGKKNGVNLAARGVTISLPILGKTVLLALITVTVAYELVFLAGFFFKTDFRIWTLAIKAFNAEKIRIAFFPYLWLFLIYYVANSVAINTFNFIKIGKKEWINTVIIAIFNALPPAILLLIQYNGFVITGELGLGISTNMVVVWLFPITVILPVTAILSRKIYRITNNPYLPGIINGIIVTLIACTNTLTWL
jgi:dienelactone hydrolase